MGLQLIFVVESNKQCQSDWIYIKNTINRFYKYSKEELKLSTVYMNGKNNYLKCKKEVDKQIKLYGKMAINNNSKVIFCFDCDDYDKKREDKVFLDNVIEFCKKNKYEFVWFCKDIESVYLGEKVSSSDKKKKASNFANKNLIEKLDENKLIANKYTLGKSNILNILNKFISDIFYKNKLST